MKLFSKRPALAACSIAAMTFLFFTRLGAQNLPGPTPAARAPATVGSQGPLPVHAKFTDAQVDAGGILFLQNCAFCHGKDTGGGESGPDLTRSKLVSSDKAGEAIGGVIRSGRADKGMPPFNLSESDMLSLVAFVHSQQDKAMSETGTRKGVDESDLKTGNAKAGKKYFEGRGGCTKCHSSTSLAGVATRYSGLRLEMQMLYPRDVKPKVTVKTHSGKSYSGMLEYQDEFTIGMKDSSGAYLSWPVTMITFEVDKALDEHLAALVRYSDDDIHNVLAYIQTLK